MGGHIVETIRSFGKVIATYFSAQPENVATGIIWRRLNVADSDSVFELFDAERPKVVLHAAAMAGISKCESHPDDASRVNVAGTANVAGAAKEFGAYMILMSTDMVFDGEKAPYTEESSPNPLFVYGRTKLEAEAQCPPEALVARLALCFGRSLNPMRATFFEEALGKIAIGREALFFEDEWRAPLWAGDLGRLMPMLLDLRPAGILHIGGPQRMTRLDMGRRACNILGQDVSFVKALSRSDVPGPPRPRDLTFDTSRLKELFPGFRFTAFEEAVRISFGSRSNRASP